MIYIEKEKAQKHTRIERAEFHIPIGLLGHEAAAMEVHDQVWTPLAPGHSLLPSPRPCPSTASSPRFRCCELVAGLKHGTNRRLEVLHYLYERRRQGTEMGGR